MSTICLHCLLRSACAWHSRANERVRSKSWGDVLPQQGQFYVVGRLARRHQGADTKSARIACTHQKQRTECDRIWHRDSLVVIVRCALLYYRLFLGDQIYVVVVECFCFSLSKKHALFWRFFFLFLSKIFLFCLRMLATLTSGLRKPFRRGVEIVKIVRF